MSDSKKTVGVFGATGVIGAGIAADMILASQVRDSIEELMLVGRNKHKLDAATSEVVSKGKTGLRNGDFYHGEQTLPKISTHTNTSSIAPDVWVFAASVPFDVSKLKDPNARNSLLTGNAFVVADFMDDVEQQILKTGKAPVIVNISNPLGPLSSFMAKRMGEILDDPEAANRVIGSAGALDTDRAVQVISSMLGIDRADMQFVTASGEHGMNMVVPAQMAIVKDMPLQQYLEESPDIEDPAAFYNTMKERVSMMGLDLTKTLGRVTSEGPRGDLFSIISRVVNPDAKPEKQEMVTVHAWDPIEGVVIGAPGFIGAEGAQHFTGEHEYNIHKHLSASEQEMWKAGANAIRVGLEKVEMIYRAKEALKTLGYEVSYDLSAEGPNERISINMKEFRGGIDEVREALRESSSHISSEGAGFRIPEITREVVHALEARAYPEPEKGRYL